MPNYISKITLPNGTTYSLKDAEARALIAELAAGSLAFVVSEDAATTPSGLIWDDGQTEVVGTLQPSATTKGKIYLVPQENEKSKDIFAEYVTITAGTAQNPTYFWEKLGDTEINFDNLGALAYKNSASGSTSLSTADSASFSNGSLSASATYTPAGSISVTLGQTSTAATLTKSDYTPQGTISKPNITVTSTTATVEVKDQAGSVTAGSAASFTEGAFHAGSCTKAADTFTAPSLTTTVGTVQGEADFETLVISFSAGSFTEGSLTYTAPSKDADTFTANTPTVVTLPTFKEQSVMTGASAELAATPTFTGTQAQNILVTGVSYDKASVASQTFEGTEATISSSGTVSGDVTLTKTEKTITVTVN